MSRPLTPEGAARNLQRALWNAPWFLRVAIEGIGPDAEIVLVVHDLAEAQAFIDRAEGAWSGYPLRGRRSGS